MSIPENTVLHHWETRGRRFKSSRSDQLTHLLPAIANPTRQIACGMCSHAICSKFLHRRRQTVLAEKNGSTVQGTIRLTLGRHEYDSTGFDFFLGGRNKRNYRYIGRNFDFLFAALVG